jgi:hypothetical protein
MCALTIRNGASPKTISSLAPSVSTLIKRDY